MSYENKENGFLEVAIYCETKAYLNSAVNRYYYSILMRMKHLLNFSENSQEFKGKASHIILLEEFGKIKKYKSFHSKIFFNFKAIKRLRVKADYDFESISAKDFETFKVHFNLLTDLLREV